MYFFIFDSKTPVRKKLANYWNACEDIHESCCS